MAGWMNASFVISPKSAAPDAPLVATLLRKLWRRGAMRISMVFRSFPWEMLTLFVFKDAPSIPKCFFAGVNICPNWERHRPLSHSRRQIETHLSRTLTNDARAARRIRERNGSTFAPLHFAEYASPLLLYTPSPSMMRGTAVGYADPQRLRTVQNVSQQQQQQHHSLQLNHQHQRSEPNWEEFFPPPPPPPQQHQEQHESSVACYASTEICKVHS